MIKLLFVVGAALALSACTSDPDLEPEPTRPQSDSRQNPWNEPIPGQGGGAFGALPQQPRR